MDASTRERVALKSRLQLAVQRDLNRAKMEIMDISAAKVLDPARREELLAELYRKIGQLNVELEWLKKKSQTLQLQKKGR